MSETHAIVLRPGVPVEILENRVLSAHVLTDQPGSMMPFRQDVGGWIAMPPEHWKSVQAEILRLRKKCGEAP